ncbi:MAG: hypothetical protein WAT59_13295, partial [Blautia wexlerae]
YSGSIPFTSSFADPRSVSCSRRYVVHPSGLSKRWLTFFPKPTLLISRSPLQKGHPFQFTCVKKQSDNQDVISFDHPTVF